MRDKIKAARFRRLPAFDRRKVVETLEFSASRLDFEIELTPPRRTLSSHRNEICRLRVLAADLKLPRDGRLRSRFRRTLEGEIAPIARASFGVHRAYVTVLSLRDGSIDVWVAISVLGSGAFNFLKDYEKLRAGAKLFQQDITKHARQLRSTFRAYSGGNALSSGVLTDRLSDEEIARLRRIIPPKT